MALSSIAGKNLSRYHLLVMRIFFTVDLKGKQSLLRKSNCITLIICSESELCQGRYDTGSLPSMGSEFDIKVMLAVLSLHWAIDVAMERLKFQQSQ